MDFKPEHYYRTALERMEQARHLYNLGTGYALALYVAGLAVECLLRAFKMKHDPTFDERHNLLRLFQASGMLKVRNAALLRKGVSVEDAASYAKELRVSLNVVCALWSNKYRFASEAQLRSHLKRTTGYEKIKGDYLKAITLRVLSAAQRFIHRGVLLWSFSAK